MAVFLRCVRARAIVRSVRTYVRNTLLTYSTSLAAVCVCVNRFFNCILRLDTQKTLLLLLF